MDWLLSIGIPMGLQFSITAMGTIIVRGAIGAFGSVYIIGFSIAGKIQSIVPTVFVIFGATATTCVRQNQGASRMDRIHQGVKSIQLMVLVWNVVMILVLRSGWRPRSPLCPITFIKSPGFPEKKPVVA